MAVYTPLEAAEVEAILAGYGVGRPVRLEPKEGLALLNGTQVSTALALAAVFRSENVLAAALVAGAMSSDAVKGSDTPFDRAARVIPSRQIASVTGFARVETYGSISCVSASMPSAATSSARCHPRSCNTSTFLADARTALPWVSR